MKSFLLLILLIAAISGIEYLADLNGYKRGNSAGWREATIAQEASRITLGKLGACKWAAAFSKEMHCKDEPTPAVAGQMRVETHYAPAENLEHLDVELVAHAARTIDIAAYVLTDVPVIDALAAAGARGVRVRLYRDSAARQAGRAVTEALERLAAAPNVELRIKPTRVFMHLKSYCIDARLLRAGAANFTASGLKRQENDLILIEGETACAGFGKTFATMWEKRR